MRRTWRVQVQTAALAAGVALAIGACGASSSSSAAGAKASASPPSAHAARARKPKTKAKGTIPVGIEATLSGASPLPGYADGGKAYFDYMNAHGGFDGYEVKYYVADTANEAAQTLEVTQKLVKVNHIDALEAFASIPASVLVPKASEFQVPQVNLSDGDPFSPGPKWAYDGAPSYHGMWEYAFSLVKSYFHKSTVALAYDDNAFGEPLDQVAGKTHHYGLKLAASVAVPGDLTSGFAAYAARLKASHAPVVVDSDVPEIFTGIVKAADAIGYNPIWLTNWGGEPPAVAQSLGSEMKRVYCIDFLPSPLTAKNHAEKIFRAVVGKKYHGEVTDPFAGQGWNNAALIGYGITQAAKKGRVNASTINAALAKVHGRPIGLMPSVTMSGRSHIAPDEMHLVRWTGSKLVAVTPFTKIP